MVFPDMIAVHNVKINKDEAARFRRTFLTKRASKPPHLRGEEEIDTEEMDGFKISKLRYKAMVLICWTYEARQAVWCYRTDIASGIQ